MEIAFWDMFFRLLAALILGAFIGVERRSKGKVAGIRTMMLVSLGAAAFTVTGLAAMDALMSVEQAVATAKAAAIDTAKAVTDNTAEQVAETVALVRLDTSRVIAGIVGGIGFIGAGTIIQARGKVHGVTTASCIWVAAAVGVACGLSQYSIAIVVSIFSVFALMVYDIGSSGATEDE